VIMRLQTFCYDVYSAPAHSVITTRAWLRRL
jgi:hypothetical protein